MNNFGSELQWNERIYQYELKHTSTTGSELSFETESREFHWKSSKEENRGKLESRSNISKKYLRPKKRCGLELSGGFCFQVTSTGYHNLF